MTTERPNVGGDTASTRADSQPGRTGRRLHLFRLGSVSLSLVVFGIVALLIGEGAIRLFAPVSDAALMFWDPLIGPRRRPNQSGFTYGTDMRGSYHINAQGWNHPHDYVANKPEGTRRICLVGDSFVEALHVQPQQTHFMVADRIMNRPDRPVQWYAFGCSGFGTAQQYLLIRHYVLHYRPDVVVLLFCENDPYDSSPYLLPRGSSAATFVLDEHSQLEWMPPAPWVPSLWKQMAKSSALARYLILQKNLLRREGRVARAWRSMQAGGFVSMVDGDMTLRDRGRKTWALIETLLAATRDECTRHGATLLLAYAGNFNKLQAAFLGQAYAAPPREEDPFCLDPHKRQCNLAEDFLEPISSRLGIAYLDLTDAIMEESKRTGCRYDFPRDEHYSAVGHAAVGKALAAWIETAWAE